MKITLIINTPTSFQAIWTFVKGFLDEKVRRKILMLGSKYHDKLFKVCDPEQIPTFYGGKCEYSFLEADSKQPWYDYELVDEPGSGPD